MGKTKEHERDRGLIGLNVRVRYFSVARQIANRLNENVEVGQGSSVEALGQEIVRLHPGFKPIMNSVRFSVNHEIVRPGKLMREDDEIGVLPPVAGG